MTGEQADKALGLLERIAVAQEKIAAKEPWNALPLADPPPPQRPRNKSANASDDI